VFCFVGIITEYEWDFTQKAPTPLRKLDELGPRVKAASKGQPAFTFYLWAARDPKDLHGSRQYYLTTVSGGDVVVRTAIVGNDTQDDIAFQAFESYITYFQHVLDNKELSRKTVTSRGATQQIVWTGAPGKRLSH
jgi:hypothetical protein